MLKYKGFSFFLSELKQAAGVANPFFSVVGSSVRLQVVAEKDFRGFEGKKLFPGAGWLDGWLRYMS